VFLFIDRLLVYAAVSACQKTFVTNHVGDFCLLLEILVFLDNS
jgi:NADH:ubiquinone oxidoreductase subunit 5 (subunit L)/multisubunit Na+/H+ antiporter MnhA subunit